MQRSLFINQKYLINNVKMEKFLKIISKNLNRNLRIYFASSAAVYGITKNLKINEKSKCKPLSPYGSSKLLGEKY